MLLFYFSLLILSLIMGAQVILRFFVNNKGFDSERKIEPVKIYKYILIFSSVIVFLYWFYQAYLQYFTWKNNEFSKLLLPPHQSIGYFLFYVGIRFFGPHIASFLTAIIFIYLAKFLNKKYEEKFFYSEEFYLAAVSIFLVGYPAVIFYFISLILIYLIIHFASLAAFRSQSRISLYYLWILTAIFIILATEFYLKTLPFWPTLRF